MTRRGVTFSFLESILRAPPSSWMLYIQGREKGWSKKWDPRKVANLQIASLPVGQTRRYPSLRRETLRRWTCPQSRRLELRSQGEKQQHFALSQQHPGLRGWAPPWSGDDNTDDLEVCCDGQKAAHIQNTARHLWGFGEAVTLTSRTRRRLQT